MKKSFSIVLLFIVSAFLVSLQTGCKKEPVIEFPAVSTSAITSITTTSASGGGNVTSDGGATTSRGICWNTAQNPTVSLTKANIGTASSGTGTGSYTCSITGLTAGTTYYVRAYATNSKGTVYGNQEQFSTTSVAPTLTTTAASAITSSTASAGGNISADGGASITARGVCWSTAQNPTTADSKTTDASGTGVFTSSITGLAPATFYYVRAYATNSVGTSYGLQVSFTTPAPSYTGTSLLAVKVVGIWWAPVNVGYVQTTLPYGLLFQWNRKYGQDYVTTGVVTGGVTLVEGNNIANKDLFYAHVVALTDWTSTWQATWSEYTPCPTGWRVPTLVELQALMNAGSTWVTTGGVDNLAGRWFGGNHNGDHTGSVFLPASGIRNFNGNSALNRGTSGAYWSFNTGHCLWENSSAVQTTIMYQQQVFNSYGYSVRCVQN